MFTEKRKYSRTDIFLIIHFRHIHNSYEYALGISRNYSDAGFSMESHNFDYKPGHILECTISHPETDLSLSILGEIVWKKDGWYDAYMGIKFLHIDQNYVKVLQQFACVHQRQVRATHAEDSTFIKSHENHPGSMVPDTSFAHDVRPPAAAEKTQDDSPPAMPSSKTSRPYFWFVLILALSGAILFSVTVPNSRDIFSTVDLSALISGRPLPVQSSMGIGIPTPAIPANPETLRKAEPDTKPRAGQELKIPELPKDIIRDTITFDVNSSAISEQFTSVLDKVADILLGNPGLTVKLEGHTDSAGSEIYNMDLSLRRAAAVRSELMKKGILSSRIKIMCFGNAHPAASNDSVTGRMKNRRVEIAIPGLES